MWIPKPFSIRSPAIALLALAWLAAPAAGADTITVLSPASARPAQGAGALYTQQTGIAVRGGGGARTAIFAILKAGGPPMWCCCPAPTWRTCPPSSP